jgi:hypothetical protein
LIKNLITILSSVVIVCCVSSCGGGGEGGGSSKVPKNPPPVEPPAPSALHTSVGIYPNSHKKLAVSSCFRFAEHALPKVEASFAIDGDLADWANTVPMLADPVDDAAGAFDLAEVQVGSFGDGLVVALAYPNNSASHLYFEFGGVVSRDGQIQSEVKHLIKYDKIGFSELRAGGWEPISEGVLQFASSSKGLEVSFPGRLIGDTITWPAWWVRVVAEEPHTENWDSTHAAYFPSVLGGDSLPFSFTRCTQWSSMLATVSQMIITHQIPAPINPSPDYIADGTFDIRREHALQLGRYALDLSRMLPVKMAYGSMFNTVLVSDLVEPGSLIVNSLSHPVISNGETYRLLGLNTRNMGFRPDSYFPQGQVLDSALHFHLKHMLRTQAQFIETGTLDAVTHAIVHDFKKNYLSQQYWFDYRWNQTVNFLDNSDGTSPKGLDELFGSLPLSGPERSQALAFYHSKVRAASQLLGESHSPEELLLAWKNTTAEINKATPSNIKGELFVQKLIDDLKPDDSRRLVPKLFDGYLTSKSYDPTAIPDVHRDNDNDGLPLFIERKIGTSDQKTDTDADGWSDLVEYTGGFDPGSATKFPGLIVADGIFSEWQNLLASKIIIDRGQSGLCEKDADIQFYAAVADRDYLAIGAVAGDFWNNESKARWEVVVDLPKENRAILIVAPNRDRVVQVKDPVTNAVFMSYPQAIPAGGKVAEIVVDRQSLRIASPFTGDLGVRLKLRTVYESKGEPIFCDETSWFEPYIK